MKKISDKQIFKLQFQFSIAYFIGIVLMIAFLCVFFVLANWALGFMIAELIIISPVPITVNAHVISMAIILAFMALSLIQNSKILRDSLVNHWREIVDLKKQANKLNNNSESN